MKHITDKEYCELGMKTALQWAKEKMVPNKDSGIMLWCNPYHNRYAIYYRSDEVHKASEEELDMLLRPIRENRKKSREKRKQREKEAYREALEAEYEQGKMKTREEYEKAISRMQHNYKKTVYSLAAQREPVTCSNCTGKIVFDVETTGLNAETDEILQISIIDGEGKVLINSYVKPYYTENWSDTEPIHGITKEMVENAPYPHELIPSVKGIFDNAAEWIGYNGVLDGSYQEIVSSNEKLNIERY